MEERTLLSTITVTSIADSGPGTLRQALINAAPSGDVINFAKSIRNKTITLTSSELAFGKSLEIDGSGQTISGASARRVFHLTTPGATVTIMNLQIDNGLADQGAGLLDEGANLTLNGVTFRSDQALGTLPGSDGMGGGLAVIGPGATVSITGGEFVSTQPRGASGSSSGGPGGSGYGGVSTPGRTTRSPSPIPPKSPPIKPGAATPLPGKTSPAATAGVAASRSSGDGTSLTVSGGLYWANAAYGGNGNNGGNGGPGGGGAIYTSSRGTAVLTIKNAFFLSNKALGGKGADSTTLLQNGGSGGGASGGAVYASGATVMVAAPSRRINPSRVTAEWVPTVPVPAAMAATARQVPCTQTPVRSLSPTPPLTGHQPGWQWRQWRRRGRERWLWR